jgi:hypothetical protein
VITNAHRGAWLMLVLAACSPPDGPACDPVPPPASSGRSAASIVDNLTWASATEILAVVHTGGARALVEPCLMAWAVWSAHAETLVGSMSETRIGLWTGPE